MLKRMFGVLVGRVPKEDRGKYWTAFTTLITEVVKAGAEGAVKGAKEK